MPQGSKKIDITPEIVNDVCQRLMDGESTGSISRSYGMSEGWSWLVAQENGLKWHRDPMIAGQGRNKGQWRKVNSGEPAQMPIEEYEALLSPDPRDDTPADVAPADDQNSDIQSVIAEARTLLQQAAADRRAQGSAIEAKDAEIERLSARVQELKAKVEEYQPKAERYDVIKRQQDAQKLEISRRLLRQDMDDLRSAMAAGS